MIPGLLLLGARRVAALPILLLVALASALPFVDTTPKDLAALPELANGAAGAPATAWLAALVVATSWAAAWDLSTLEAAAAPPAPFRNERRESPWSADESTLRSVGF